MISSVVLYDSNESEDCGASLFSSMIAATHEISKFDNKNMKFSVYCVNREEFNAWLLK